MSNMTRHEMVEATPWSAAVAGGIMAVGLTRFRPEMEAAEVPLVLFLGAIGLAPLMATTKERPPTLNDRAGAWLGQAGIVAILGAFYGLLAALPVGLLLSAVVYGLLDVELPWAALYNLAGVGALVPPAVRYWRLPVGGNGQEDSL